MMFDLPAPRCCPWRLAQTAALAGLCTAPTLAASAPAANPAGPSLLPLLLVFMLVLSLIPLALWALKRLGPQRLSQQAAGLSVVAQLSLGARERVVVLEAGERWILLGVTAHSISRLGSLPKGTVATAQATPSFSSLLQRFKA